MEGKRFLKKSALLVLIAVTLPVFSGADEPATGCEVISRLAKSIMQARQSGVSMSEMMGIAARDEDFKALAEALVIDAYDSPRYSTDGMKQRSIEDFENNVFLQCIKATR